MAQLDNGAVQTSYKRFLLCSSRNCHFVADNCRKHELVHKCYADKSSSTPLHLLASSAVSGSPAEVLRLTKDVLPELEGTFLISSSAASISCSNLCSSCKVLSTSPYCTCLCGSCRVAINLHTRNQPFKQLITYSVLRLSAVSSDQGHSLLPYCSTHLVSCGMSASK